MPDDRFEQGEAPVAVAFATAAEPGRLLPVDLTQVTGHDDRLAVDLASHRCRRAVGVTVLVPGTRLRWADEGVPSALFETDHPTDLAKLVADALPTPEALARSAIARTLPGTETLTLQSL